MSFQLSGVPTWRDPVLARRVAGRRSWRSARGLLAWAERAWRCRSSRMALAMLDERLLKDIGASRSDALIEAGKPFWRP